MIRPKRCKQNFIHLSGYSTCWHSRKFPLQKHWPSTLFTQWYCYSIMKINVFWDVMQCSLVEI